MKTTQEVLKKHAESPLAAASELVTRLQGTPDLNDAAAEWCSFFAPSAHLLRSPSSSSVTNTKGSRATLLLLQLACGETPILCDLVARSAAYGEEKLPLLSAALAIWPTRNALENVQAALLAWRERVDPMSIADVAAALDDAPELAYALLGPIRYAPPTGPCFGCVKHPRDLADTGFGHLQLLFERRRHRRESVPEDARVLEVLRGTPLVVEPVLQLVMRDWLREGIEEPPGFRQSVDACLEQGGEARTSAIALLCASPRDHETAVSTLAVDIERAEAPVEVMAEIAKLRLVPIRFRGAGWNRDARPRKLLPLSLALLSRGVWPVDAWIRLLEPEFGKQRKSEDDRDQSFEYLREVMAEAMLSIARDVSRARAERMAALDALEELRPGGNGSWAKALSKIEDGAIVERAREVQRSLRGLRDGPADAELSIADACEAFLGDPRGSTP